MKPHNLFVIPAICAAVLLSSFAVADAAQSYGLYLQVKGFNWTEYDGSDQLLEESGPLFGIGLRLDPDLYKLSAQGKIEAYFGQVNYDGQTMGGTPVDDETAYVGFFGDLDAALPAWVAASKKESILLFAGGGAHVWQRDLGQVNEDLVYTEEWMMFYARVGGGFYLADRRGYAQQSPGSYAFCFSVFAGMAVVAFLGIMRVRPRWRRETAQLATARI